MKIVNAGRGIHQREIPGIDKLRALPAHWVAFTNLDLSLPMGAREIDVIMVVDDRILLIDLKDWRGKITSSDGAWYQNGRYMDRSPVSKISANVREVYRLLKGHLEDQATRSGKRRKNVLPPRVEGLVVLTGTNDVSGIAPTELGSVMHIDAFMRTIQNVRERIETFGPVSPQFVDDPLTSNEWKFKLGCFFNVKTGPFRPGTKRYGGYRATSDDSSFRHASGLFEEFDVEDEQAVHATGILRRWDFTKAETRFQSEEGRSEIVGREREVVAWLNDRNAECETTLLQPKSEDPDRGVGYWEVFEKRRRLERLRDFIASEASRLSNESRVELARQVLARAKTLHDLDAAHLDIGEHSVWLEMPSTVRFSHLMAASYPQVKSLGESRYQFLSSVTVPEAVFGDADGNKKKDVFLLGCVVHALLFGSFPNAHREEDPPEWKSEIDERGEFVSLHPWFERALSWAAADRFESAGDMLSAFNDALSDQPSRREVMEGLERFRTLKSQLQLIREYPPAKDLRDDDRVAMWISEQDGEPVLIKIWKHTSWGDTSKEASRILDFLERAESFSLSPEPGCVSIRRVVWLGDAIVLVQSYVDAPNLEESLDRDADRWQDSDFVFSFLLRLGELVSSLHERGIAHGDLKPQNLLVVGDEREPLLVDVLDFVSASDGEIVSRAYAPESGGRFERDRFAVTKIAEELLVHCELSSSISASLQSAISTCRSGPPENATLLPLLEALNQALVPPTSQEKSKISVAIMGAEIGPLLPDDGSFGLRRDPERHRLFIRGACEELEIDFDSSERPVAARRRRIEQKRVRIVSRYEFARLVADVEVVDGPGNDLAAIATLLEDPSIREGWDAASNSSAPRRGAESDEGDDITEVGDESLEQTTPLEISADAVAEALAEEPVTTSVVDVPRLWRKLIDAESDLTIEGVALADSSYRPDKKKHIVPFKLECGAFDFNRDDKVLVERLDSKGRWSKIGNLDLSQSSPEQIVVDVWNTQPKSGAPIVFEDQRLRFESHFEVTSRTRREEATSRVLSRRGCAPNLIDVFDTRTESLPSVMPVVAEAEAIMTRYGLNDVQAQALVDLVKMRPVGLLQGPPGTGKTKFIGALVHYALTHGLAKNVLLASQSHEAVNNAAEAVLELFNAQETLPSILRVGHEGVVSDRLLPYHVARVETLFKDRFRAEFNERLRIAGRGLGLPDDLVERVLAVETAIQPVVEKLHALREQLGDSPQEQRLQGLKATLEHQTAKLGLTVELDGDDQDVVRNLIDQVAAQFPKVGRDRVSRLRSVVKLARDLTGGVSSRQRSLENFLAGTRQIVAGTCVGLGRSSLGLTATPFDLVVVDEAARCTASELAVPIQAGRWVVLVGDQAQLEPLHRDAVIDAVVKDLGISRREAIRSDFERVFESPYGRAGARRLTKQYRMLPPIGSVVSRAFYDGALTHGRSDPVVDAASLPDELGKPLVWLSTDSLGAQGFQTRDPSGGASLCNPAEAELIVSMIKSWDTHEEFRNWLLGQKRYARPIGIICTYAAQSHLIRKKLRLSGLSDVLANAINVDTVDSYQGKENPIVILSLVRNNNEGAVERGVATIRQGFMARANRINVAISRAMDRLLIVGARTRWPSGGAVARVADAFYEQLESGHATITEATELQEKLVQVTAPKKARKSTINASKREREFQS